MKILINERLSEHRCKTPEGYLICTDAILARTGKQTYRKNEIFKDSDDETEIEVDRTEDEVFSPQTLASFENKPVTVEHPDEDVNVHNYKEYAVGFVRDVRRGEVDGQPVILGNLVITDEQTIQEIENGEHTDLSCGYDCDIADEPNPCQRNIRGNHVALCECGRAGIARIVDSKCKDFDDTGKNIRIVKEFIEQNGNKFDKRKDANAILEHIKKRTGIANADYGDVLYIIKEYTRAEITDSVKDAKYVVMHPRKNLYLTVGAKTWSYESDPMIKKFDSEKEAEEYAKKNTSDFRIAVFDSVKDEQLYAVEFSYDGDSWSNYLGHVNVRAKSEQDALTKAKRWAVEHYDNPSFFKIASTKYTNVEAIDSRMKVANLANGYAIVPASRWRKFGLNSNVERFTTTLDEARDIRSSLERDDRISFVIVDVTRRRTTDSMKDTREIKPWALHKGQTIVTEDGNATVLSVKGNNRDGYDVEVKLFPDGKDRWYFMSNEKVTVLDESPVYAVKAKYENVVLEWYVRANSEREAFDKVKRQPGHNFDTFVSAKIVKERAGMRIIDESPVNDALIPPAKESINKFESLLRILNVKIDKKGLTTFGRVHYQVRANMEFDQFVKTLNRIDDEMDKLGIPMTFNAGSDGNTCTAGIDLDKQHVKDSQRAQKIQKIVKIVKSIK